MREAISWSLQTEMLNPTVNQAALRERIAKKIVARVNRIGLMHAPGMQGVLRCGDRIIVKQNLFQDKVKAAKEYVN